VEIESCACSVVDPELKGMGTERVSPRSRRPFPLHQTEPRSPQPAASCPPPQEWPAERFLDQTRGFVQTLNSATQDPSIRRLCNHHTDFLRAKCSGVFPSCGARRGSGMHPLSPHSALSHTRGTLVAGLANFGPTITGTRFNSACIRQTQVITATLEATPGQIVSQSPTDAI
jgi:hypothetical protein